MTDPPPHDTLGPDPRDKKFSSLLDKGRADDSSWDWPATNRGMWEVVDGKDEFQEFYNHWRTSSYTFCSSGPFPYKLQLGNESPLHPYSTSDGQIVVTKSYDEMYYRLLALRETRAPGSGAVITGQPGIGKSLFLNFMLARLISAGQAVLLYTQSMLYLFHKEEVHRREGDDFSHIPINKRDDNFAMWTLIDSGTRAQPLIENWCRIWPIQVTPPNPIRWKAWRKQRDAALLGMPLWNMKELEEGLPLFPEYGNFRAMLKESLENNQADSDNKQIDAALKVLQEKDFHYERGDGPPATDQDTETPVDRSNLDCAFKVLLENAIEEFGHAPRDVYNGVFYLPTSRRERDEAVYFANYSALASFASKFSRDRHLDSLSHKLIKVEPTEAFLSKDGWDIDFKSAYILGKVMASARSEHDGYLWRAYHAFRGASASTLAGYLFEEIIHRIFAHGWMGVTHEPQLTPMVADGKPPPTFSSDPASAPLPTSSFPPLFAGGPMDTVVVDFTSNDLNITLSNKKYYRPRDYKLRITDNTLFDSFTVSLDPQGDFLISIFQITVSKSQGGSAEGYERIRKIIQCVKALAEEKEPTANVKVAYFLVCPEDELRKWKMPVGWNANNQPDDHCGEAFCVRMHVPGAPRLFASNFVT